MVRKCHFYSLKFNLSATTEEQTVHDIPLLFLVFRGSKTFSLWEKTILSQGLRSVNIQTRPFQFAVCVMFYFKLLGLAAVAAKC